MNVEKPFSKYLLSSGIREFIQEKSSMNAVNVGKSAGGKPAWKQYTERASFSQSPEPSNADEERGRRSHKGLCRKITVPKDHRSLHL